MNLYSVNDGWELPLYCLTDKTFDNPLFTLIETGDPWDLRQKIPEIYKQTNDDLSELWFERRKPFFNFPIDKETAERNLKTLKAAGVDAIIYEVEDGWMVAR